MRKHWISIDNRPTDREFHYLGYASECPPIPAGHTVPRPSTDITTPPTVEVEWDRGVRLQSLTLDADGARLLCLRCDGEWQVEEVRHDHPVFHGIVGQQLRLEEACAQHRLHVELRSDRLFPCLTLSSNGKEIPPRDGLAPDDRSLRTLSELANEAGQALEKEFERMIYLGPLRHWPDRRDVSS